MARSKERRAKYRKLNVAKPYVQIPYRILRSQEFQELSPEAVKIYFMLLRNWDAREADKPIAMAYSTIRKECHCSNSLIAKAFEQLLKDGFVAIIKEHKRTNRFIIEEKWFNGTYK